MLPTDEECDAIGESIGIGEPRGYERELIRAGFAAGAERAATVVGRQCEFWPKRCTCESPRHCKFNAGDAYTASSGQQETPHSASSETPNASVAALLQEVASCGVSNTTRKYVEVQIDHQTWMDVRTFAAESLRDAAPQTVRQDTTSPEPARLNSPKCSCIDFQGDDEDCDLHGTTGAQPIPSGEQVEALPTARAEPEEMIRNVNSLRVIAGWLRRGAPALGQETMNMSALYIEQAADALAAPLQVEARPRGAVLSGGDQRNQVPGRTAQETPGVADGLLPGPTAQQGGHNTQGPTVKSPPLSADPMRDMILGLIDAQHKTVAREPTAAMLQVNIGDRDGKLMSGCWLGEVWRAMFDAAPLTHVEATAPSQSSPESARSHSEKDVQVEARQAPDALNVRGRMYRYDLRTDAYYATPLPQAPTGDAK